MQVTADGSVVKSEQDAQSDRFGRTPASMSARTHDEEDGGRSITASTAGDRDETTVDGGESDGGGSGVDDDTIIGGADPMRERGLPPGATFDALGPEPALIELIVEGVPPLAGLAATPDGVAWHKVRAAASAARPRALVPGCGRGCSVGALAEAGYSALGIDIAPSRIAAAREYLGDAAHAEIRCADFFDGALLEPNSFDLICELRALVLRCVSLCPLPPHLFLCSPFGFCSRHHRHTRTSHIGPPSLVVTTPPPPPRSDGSHFAADAPLQTTERSSA